MMTKKISPDLIKELRDRTGIAMAKCKEALEKTGGDMELAIDHLRKTGLASAVKKEGREAKEGLIGIGETSEVYSLVEINSETDFVSQNEKFKQFLKDIASEAAAIRPSSIENFLKHKCKKDPTLTIDQYRALIVQSLGENIQIKRFLIVPKSRDISVGIYSHMGGKIVTVVEMAGGSGNEILARDIAMHVAAESPEYLSPADVPIAVKTREEEIAKSQIQGKPAPIVEKIVQGKLKSFYDLTCLLCQKYVKDNSIVIEQLLEREGKTTGKKFTIRRFARWRVGESF
ncbi:MAG: translation elongation factor Ts [Chlamydiae bacterium]|nr:translation elongation factor Ts [Chlamydiota bacterium]